jgi:hypothetical protein
MPTLDTKHIAVLVAYAVLTAVLNLIFSKRSQIDEWCEANPKLAAFAKLLRGVGIDPWTVFQSVVLAFTKKLPNYQKQTLGELQRKPQPGRVPPLPMLLLVLTLVLACGLPGCNLFGPGGSVWPKMGECAPTPETLFSEVESVLTSSGGNYEDDLLALGKSEGLQFVECAVKAVVEALSARIAARRPGERITPDEGIGVARGKAFLAKIEEAHK